MRRCTQRLYITAWEAAILNNIFADGELEENVVCAFFAHTTQHGAIEGKHKLKSLNFTSLI